ncbi:hypothetical protein UFOVP523_27 [uncultured Caudovirales phage]|uniref:DUF3310 domain-containing protein n=1 Tax=uncultured Caudovirales phage TaxID=2100421 RepID=A0A6J5MYI6_9CAUD|nr:hypothetical protein UFOVP523_27 [uncultured Caudovirales phage]
MKNTIAESKTTDLIVQVTYKDDNIIKGQVLVGDEFNHIGKVDYWSTSSFDISSNKSKAPSHYDNTNGSLYEFAEQQGLNSYEFDICKRIIRSRKKGNFKEDLEKTKFLIDLYLKEYKEC